MTETDDEYHAWIDRMQEHAAYRYQRRFSEHPYCNDPDHPGCETCDDSE
jgi:hypothetical protein